MKTELCSFCLKSGILCQKCSTKVKEGEISKLDLKIARLLLSLEEKYPSLQNISFYKAFDVGRTVAIVVGHGDVPRLLGYGGKIIKAISEETGKSIRILEQGADNRKFLEDLLVWNSWNQIDSLCGILSSYGFELQVIKDPTELEHTKK